MFGEQTERKPGQELKESFLRLLEELPEGPSLILWCHQEQMLRVTAAASSYPPEYEATPWRRQNQGNCRKMQTEFQNLVNCEAHLAPELPVLLVNKHHDCSKPKRIGFSVSCTQNLFDSSSNLTIHQSLFAPNIHAVSSQTISTQLCLRSQFRKCCHFFPL